MYSWFALLEGLSPAELTRRAQAVSPNDNGQLKYDIFFNRRPVNSTRLREITANKKRYASGRREWNTDGRLIPLNTPNIADMNMLPLEAYFPIGEEEMQFLDEGARGNQQVVIDAIGADVPSRVEELVESNNRQLELDCFEAWTKGTITAKDPATGLARTSSYMFESSRYETAGTAWNDGSVNAYDLHLAAARRAIDAMGGISGALTRQSVVAAILADAPTSAITGFKYTQGDIQRRIQDELGYAFEFLTMENTVDVFPDGGVTSAPQKVIGSGILAFIPPGGIIGDVAAAPVVRARQIAAAVPEARIDVRGQTVYYIEENGGKGLKVQCQANLFPVPEEKNIFVVQTGS
jgi:hypothetical protein